MRKGSRGDADLLDLEAPSTTAALTHAMVFIQRLFLSDFETLSLLGQQVLVMIVGRHGVVCVQRGDRGKWYIGEDECANRVKQIGGWQTRIAVQ